jgi:hypothetical protein
MNDYNHNGKFDKEDFLVMEDDDENPNTNANTNANTTSPFIVVTLIIIGILAALRLL